jgi:hypothetical protein
MRFLGHILFLLMLCGCFEGQAQTSLPSPQTDASSPAQTHQYDPLLDPPPLPAGKVALIGGSITHLDVVLNRMILRPFGDKHELRIAFDTRTQIYADGKPARESSLQAGQRVYVDTILNGTVIFAKTIRIDDLATRGSGRGQIIAYDAGSGTLTVRDELSDQPMQFRLSPTVVVRRDNQARSTADLVPGALVTLSFAVATNRPVIQEVSVLAKPGSSFTFFGKITYVDMSQHMVVVDNQSDDRKYAVHLTSIPQSILRNLREGSQVNISAVFDGSQYLARNLSFPDTHRP